MTEAEKIMIDALVKIHQLAQSWEGRAEAPYWNLGDIAASALIKAVQHRADRTVPQEEPLRDDEFSSWDDDPGYW